MSIDTRRSFHKELSDIRDDLVRMGAIICESIGRVTEALLAADRDAAQRLIDDDADLDELALDVEDRCYHQLALQQPMARDLRALVTAIRVASELERSGDLVVNIAKAVIRLEGDVDPKSRGLLQSMSDEAHALYSKAVDAYCTADGATGAALDGLDDTLDAAHRAFIAQVLESCRAGVLDIQVAVQMALVGRFYERIGDHAVNIGEKVHYLESGVVG